MGARTEIEIDGVTVFIRRYDPFYSLEVLGDLQKHVVGPAGALFAFQDGKPAMELSEYSIETAIGKISDGLDGATLVKLARKILQPDYVALQWGGMDKPAKATEGNLNLAFQEDPFGGMVQIMTEVVKLNYTAFFTRARTLFTPVASTDQNENTAAQ